MKKILSFILLSSALLFSVAATSGKLLKLVSKGETLQLIPIEEVDYIDIYDAPEIPINLTAALTEDKTVILNWSPCEDGNVTYSVYRAGEDDAFDLIAFGLTEPEFNDISPLEGLNTYRVSVSTSTGESLPSDEAAVSVISVPAIAPAADPGCYMRIVGYHTLAFNSRLDRLNNEHAKYLKSYSESINPYNKNILYYAMENALDSIGACAVPENLTSVSIITVTGATDNGSLRLSPAYSSIMEYRDSLSKRIREEKKGDIPVKSYMLGLAKEGAPMKEEIEADVATLSSNPETASLHSDINDLNTRLQEIAQKIISETEASSMKLSFRLPSLQNGAKIRLTFDNASDPCSSQYYLEGVFDAQSNSISELVLNGIASPSGHVIYGKQEGLSLYFELDQVSTQNNGLIRNDYTDLWVMPPYAFNWIGDSLFDGFNDIKVKVENKSSLVWIVMDCSTSWGEDLPTLRKGIQNLIDAINKERGDETDSTFWSEHIGRKKIERVLFIGNSYLVPQGIGNNEWYRLDAMSPSIREHGIIRLTMGKIREAFPHAEEYIYSASPWERTTPKSNFDFESTWIPVLQESSPDIIFMTFGGNAQYDDEFTAACYAMMKVVKENCPGAAIYFAPTWCPLPIRSSFRQVCKDYNIHYIDSSVYGGQENRWRPGDYYYSDEKDEYFGLKHTVIYHPNDVGALRFANDYLKAIGLKPWDITHKIDILTIGSGSVGTPNRTWVEDGIVTLRILEGEVESVKVVSESGREIEATYRTNQQNPDYSDYYTFTMPKEDVNVEVVFKTPELQEEEDESEK